MGILLATEMGGDEAFVLLASFVLGVGSWGRWYWQLFPTGGLAEPPARFRLPLVLLPPLGLLPLFYVLSHWAAVEVRTEWPYFLLFANLGAAGLVLAMYALPVLGVSLWHDALDRRNPAALVTTCGMSLGVLLAYAGANIGEGPTIWTTLGPAALAIGVLLAMGMAVAGPARAAEAVTIERDTASAVRFAGLMLALGLILGRATAGNWVSVEAVLRQFVRAGWPVLPLALLAMGFQVLLRPRVARPHPHVLGAGVIPAALLLAPAAGWLAYLGPW